jgi:transcriptional regulator with XRE-family HTH domain
MLGLSQAELAKLASVGPAGLQGFETGREMLSAKVLAKVRRVFLSAGIEFLDDEDGVGLRRRRTLDEVVAASAQPEAYDPGRSTQNGPITAEQCRAARGLLGMSQGEAAAALGVGLSTIVGLETKKVTPHARSRQQIRSGFEGRGVIFSDADGQLSVALRVENQA